MNARSRDDHSRPAHPLGPDPPRWRLWLARIAIFVVVFMLLITALMAISGIVERFFVVLYGN